MTIERQDIGGIDRLWATDREDFIGFTVHSVNKFEFEVARVLVSGHGYHFLEIFVRYKDMPEHWAKPEEVYLDERPSAAMILRDAKPTLDEICDKRCSLLCVHCGARIEYPLVVSQRDTDRIEWLIKKLEEFLHDVAPSGEEIRKKILEMLDRALREEKKHITQNRTILQVLDGEERTEQ